MSIAGFAILSVLIVVALKLQEEAPPLLYSDIEQQATQAIAAGDLSSAIDAYQQFLKEDHDQAETTEARLRLIDLYIQTGDYISANDDAKLLASIYEELPIGVLLSLATTSELVADYAPAIEYYQQLIARYEESDFQDEDNKSFTENMRQQLKNLQTVVKEVTVPLDVLTLSRKAEISEELGRSEAARDFYLEIVNLRGGIDAVSPHDDEVEDHEGVGEHSHEKVDNIATQYYQEYLRVGGEPLR